MLLFLMNILQFSLFFFISFLISLSSFSSFSFISFTFYCLFLSYSYSFWCLLLLREWDYKRLNLFLVVMSDILIMLSMLFFSLFQILTSWLNSRRVSSILACMLVKFWSQNWKFTCFSFSSIRRINYIAFLPYLVFNQQQISIFLTNFNMQSTGLLDNQIIDLKRLSMNLQKTFNHTSTKSDYVIKVTVDGEIRLHLSEKFGLTEWQGCYSSETVMEVTSKTGHTLQFQQFWSLLIKAFEQKEISCYIDILSSQDLQMLKNKSSATNTNKTTSKSNKRYLILTYMTNDQKYHYPLALNVKNKEYDVPELKEIYSQLRVELESARAAALNDTSKNENSFSINYQNKKNSKNQSKLKEIDQFKSENQILKAKLARLEEQVEKKKANIEIEAAIERTNQLKESIETANLQLVDWKNNISDQQQRHTELKKELTQLHKKICALLTSQKEVGARKKGEQVEKELNQVRNATKKNNVQLQRLKKQLQASKAKVKQLELKAKKLNSEKEVLRKGGRKGPYSSAGSVRSYNSFGSSKKSYNSGVSSSKPKSNYSYNSYKLR